MTDRIPPPEDGRPGAGRGRLPQQIIRAKRERRSLDRADIDTFVAGLVDGRWSDGQAAALAMAICLNGMDAAETVALTDAMTRSGAVLDWRAAAGAGDSQAGATGALAGLDGPLLDKHSTGGVGDKVSLILAPLVAACGGIVPMLSGRGLGHTGGTLDKLESIPGYRADASLGRLRAALAAAGCAIVGASAELAPADRRLYAIRDQTATVESLPLIVASILSKKRAAGIDALVMDVKTGNGAFAASRDEARALARALVEVGRAAGLPTRAWVTDMNQVLGTSCGNALEVAEALAFLQGRTREPRLDELVRTLGVELLLLGGLAADAAEAAARLEAALVGGAALERFGRMVAALGGPADFVARADAWLPRAPVVRALTAPRGGWIGAVDTGAIGWVVVGLGGGRRRAGDAVDPRVGLSEVSALGRRVEPGDRLAWVHAASEADAEAACAQLLPLFRIGAGAPAVGPVLLERHAGAEDAGRVALARTSTPLSSAPTSASTP